MIGTLLREQLRAQRAALVWMTVLIAGAAGFATYAWTANLTDEALAQQAAVLQGHGDFADTAAVVEDHSNDLIASDWGTPMTRDEIADFVAQANAEGAGVVSHVTAWNLRIVPDVTVETDIWSGYTSVRAFAGEVPWDEALTSGTPPSVGEIAIPADVAERWDVGIGDSVEVGYSTWDTTDEPQDVSAGTRTVSAIVEDAVAWSGDWSRNSTSALAPDDPAFALSFGAQPEYERESYSFPQVEFTWETSTVTTEAWFPVPSPRWSPGDSQAGPAIMLAAVLALGTVVAAVAVGRSQAQRRARWTATARALGASRSSIAVATLGEGAVVGLTGGLAGLGVGLGVASVNLDRVLSSHTAPPDVSLIVPLAALVTALVGGLALGLVVTAIPAALAARVSPASALKDAAAVDEAELTRHVRVWPVVAFTVTAYIAAIVLMALDDGRGSWWPGLCGVAAAVAGFACMIEASRRTAVTLGNWLSRRRAPAAVRAGLDLLAHPRQAASLLLVQLLTTGVLVTITATMSEPGSADFGWSAYATSDVTWSTLVDVAGWWLVAAPVSWRTALAVMVAVQVLAGAIIAGSRGLASGEEATTRALGIDARDARRAEFLRTALPQCLGVVAGAVMAFSTTLPIVLIRTSQEDWPLFPDPSTSALYAALLVGLGLVVIAAGAALAWAVRAAGERTRRRPATAQQSR
ncbi:MAG: FtsX-like permease family protein [Demequina sp.]|uniref:FtsX-like permease family protein n=1 Tax=Demequina sp. TaxID=2050685 RepID=UPI003A836AE5